MKKVIILNKKEGETPLEALEKFRHKNKAYKDVSMTYAGRLDPLARGLLLILAGEEVKNKTKYLNLDKEYKFEVLFGFATDTHDVLGKVTEDIGREYKDKKELRSAIEEHLPSFLGKIPHKYPMYSSKTIAGVPLYMYAREGIAIEPPKREIQVYRLKILSMRKVDKKKILKEIKQKIDKIWGDFRQKEILRIWERKLTAKRKFSKNKDGKFFIVRFRINCSSGTYVRSIAHSLGEAMGTPALAYSIKRTKIGKWKEE